MFVKKWCHGRLIGCVSGSMDTWFTRTSIAKDDCSTFSSRPFGSAPVVVHELHRTAFWFSIGCFAVETIAPSGSEKYCLSKGYAFVSQVKDSVEKLEDSILAATVSSSCVAGSRTGSLCRSTKSDALGFFSRSSRLPNYFLLT